MRIRPHQWFGRPRAKTTTLRFSQPSGIFEYRRRSQFRNNNNLFGDMCTSKILGAFLFDLKKQDFLINQTKVEHRANGCWNSQRKSLLILLGKLQVTINNVSIDYFRWIFKYIYEEYSLWTEITYSGVIYLCVTF